MSRTHVLLTSQKNEVLEILRTEGLEPAHFEWTEHLSKRFFTVSRLNYLNGDYYFQFSCYLPRFFCILSPGDFAREVSYHPKNWEEQKVYFIKWLLYLKREIEAPDLWAEMEKYRATLPLASSEQLVNEPIPANEADEISEKLQLLADKIEQQFKPNKEQNQFVRSRLNYLTEAAKRQPRRDWENIFIGVFIGIAFQLALEPTKMQQFWQLVKSIVGPFIHLIGS